MSTIADSILSLLEPGKSRKVDVLYRFDGTREVVSAHKYLLAFISPVLDEKFFGPLAMPPGEFPEGVEEIEENEFGFETFDIFVKHVYGDKEVIKNSSNYRILMELLQLSKLYFMTGLADLVATRIDELQVNMENLMEVLVTLQGHRWVCRRLRQRDLQGDQGVLQAIKQGTEQVLQGEQERLFRPSAESD